MAGWNVAAPQTLSAGPDRAEAGQLNAATPYGPDTELKFRISVPEGSVAAVALVNGSWDLEVAEALTPEISLYVVEPGEVGEFPPPGEPGFAPSAGPFHVVRTSGGAAPVNKVLARTLFRRSP